ncbi:MAG: T9SS type A sorting domain-containing protein [Saprospiraceae bacterium]|nr:T9SS type A sorting domain-containing protein [Saprospiraceae bacterium]
MGTKRFFSSQTIGSRVITFDTSDPSAPRAVATSQNGTVCTTSGTAKYELTKFYVETSGVYNLTTTFAAFNNTAIFIADGFNVSSPCTGNKFVGTNAYSTGGSGIQAFNPATVNLTACTEYVMVHYGSSSTETITLAGPGTIYRSDAAPSVSYAYTFVAISSSTGQVVAIDPNANFSTPVQGSLTTGNYTVKGISYLTTDGNVISIGTTETAILNSGKCLLFSSNAVSLQVTAPQNASIPTNISATDGTYSDKVRVTWSGTAGNFFRVYRNTSNNSATAVALSAWQTATTYDDLSAVLSTTYYYWLKAATDGTGNNSSAFSSFDTGFSESCTPAEVNLTTPITGTVTIESTGAINASSSIEPGANATFQAGESISLVVGFSAKAGSVLTCIIAPIGQRCGPVNGSVEARTAQISPKAPINIQCFPNPFDGDLTIQYELETAQTVSIAVYDLTGRRVQTIVQSFQEAGTQQLYLNSPNLDAGVYWLILKGETWQKIEKIIRQ